MMRSMSREPRTRMDERASCALRQCVLAALGEMFAHAPQANAALCVRRAQPADGPSRPTLWAARGRRRSCRGGRKRDHAPAPARHHWLSDVAVGAPFATARADYFPPRSNVAVHSTLGPRERNRGCYWTHCHRCGKALKYFDTYEEAKAASGERRRR